jgi:hypothetical protein
MGVTESADDRSEHARAARAVGLEVRRVRYLRTLDRLRRCGRASRLAALLGPLDGVVSDGARHAVEVASADARVVVGKLWTTGERYRRMLETVDRDPDLVDPGAGRSPAAVADLRQHLSEVPARFDAGEYRAVAETLAAARATIRALFEAREADCEAFAGVDPDRLEAVAEAAAKALRTEHRHRREARRRQRGESRAEPDYRTPVGNSDQIHPEALDPENVDPELIASLADEDEEAATVVDDLPRTVGRDAGTESGREERTTEEVIGSSFDIQVDEDGATVVDASESDGPDEEREGDGPADDDGGFQFGAVEGDEDRDRD